MKVAFIHPDLGIGGAERLVVDAAVGLQDLGGEVVAYTSHCDKTHCFEEVSTGVLKTKVYGDFLPTSILTRFHILCAILRQFYLVVKLILTGEVREYDYFVVDQLSFCVPLLVLFKRPEARVLFYCHFPDQLLSQPQGALKRLYRVPFDALEEYTTGLSDKIVVNSKFTKGVFKETFTNITQDPDVIYPCVDIDQALIETEEDKKADIEVKEFFGESQFLLSINRFERKKNIELAINAFSEFRSGLKQKAPKLVVAGGFDARVRENVEYLHELEALAKSLNLQCFTIRGKLLVIPPSTDILFLPSIKSPVKKALIKRSELLLYTPKNEHFGIVPVESMLFKTPVLAPNNGGPLESISKDTGFNVELDSGKWAETILKVHNMDPKERQAMGENGFKSVLAQFSRPQMSQQFLNSLENMEVQPKGWLIEGLQRVRWRYIAVVGVALLIQLAVRPV